MNIINLKSQNQKKLFNYNKLFSTFANLYDKNNLPNKMIFSGKKGIGKATFAYHLVNYIFTKNEEFKYDLKNFEINSLNKSHHLISNNSHPNFYLIDLLDDKKNIEISQIRNMYKYVNKSAFNNKERIILINNAESLNLNSANALLKVIEEPNDNVFFILIYDNSKKILETINSRCLKFNFYLSSNSCVETVNNLIDNDVYKLINKELLNYYYTIGDIINLLNLSNSLKLDISKISLKNLLLNIIEKNYYKNNPYAKNYIYNYVDLYFLNLINFNIKKNKVAVFYEEFIKKIYFLKKFNLDEESFFIKLKAQVLNG